jgi:hypothetical protein
MISKKIKVESISITKMEVKIELEKYKTSIQ